MKTKKLLTIISRIIKGIILVLPFLLIAWLLEKNYVLSGKRIVSYDFSSDNETISHLEPWQRLSPIEKNGTDYSQQINDGLVYFNAKRDISFEKVTIQLTYQSTGADIINVGMRINNKDGFKKIPLESSFIDDLEWNHIELQNGNFYQKELKYKNENDFFNNPPLNEKILVHNFDLPQSSNWKTVPKENIAPLRHFTSKDEYSYLLTSYTPPKTEKNTKWKVAQNTFLFGEAYKDKDNNVRFSIDAPGLKENDGTIVITNITLIFEKPPVGFQKISEKIQNFFNI